MPKTTPFVNKQKPRLIQLTLAISLCLNSCYTSDSGLFGECKDATQAKSTSPNQRLEAVVFHRDCGATTLVSTIIILNRINRNANLGQDRIFILEGEDKVSLKWINSKKLKISYAKGETFLKKAEIDGIIIEYERINRK
jgi:hypothetical protein